MAKVSTDKCPTLILLVTVSSRSWLPFQMLALLPGNQRPDRQPGWASMLGNDSFLGIPGLLRRASESFLGTWGFHKSSSHWPFWLYHLIRGAIPHILQTGSLLLMGLFSRVHPGWHILARMTPCWEHRSSSSLSMVSSSSNGPSAVMRFSYLAFSIYLWLSHLFSCN